MQRLQIFRPAVISSPARGGAADSTAMRRIRAGCSLMSESCGIAGLLGVEEPLQKAVVPRKVAHFLLAEAARVARAIPIKVGDYRCFATELRVPEALKEVPVDKALNVVAAALDSECRYVGRVKLYVESAESPPKLGELFRHRPELTAVDLLAIHPEV